MQGWFHVTSEGSAIITPGFPTLATDLKRLAEIRPSRGLEDAASVFRPSEQDDRAGVRLLAQALDNVVEHLVVSGAGHLQRGRDADVTLSGLAREHFDSILAVAALGVYGGDVRPIGTLHHVNQRDRLEGVRRYRPCEVVEPENQISGTLEMDSI